PLAATGRDRRVLGTNNFSGPVPTSPDANPPATPADFSAFVVWDNGNADFATITGTGPFTVSAAHNFGAFPNAHTITVTINDRGGSAATVTDTVIDPVAVTPNERFVAQLYQDLLGREVEPAGLAGWSSLLDQGAARAQVALAIAHSPAYRAAPVQDLYPPLL